MKSPFLFSSFLLMMFIILINIFSPWLKLLASASSFVYPENYNKIELPKVSGPESIAFDCHGNGPYVSVSDGRILKWEGPNLAWKEFAFTSPNRQEYHTIFHTLIFIKYLKHSKLVLICLWVCLCVCICVYLCVYIYIYIFCLLLKLKE